MKNENSAWQTWFDQHGAALILFARQRTSCLADAEDVVQSAFVRFWKHRESAEDPLAYLYACVCSVAKDQHRSDARRVQRERSSWFLKEDTPAEVEADQIQQAMTTLPSEQREVVVLKIWGGLTFKAMAEVLAIPANTAASRYRYAMEALKGKLTRETES